MNRLPHVLLRNRVSRLGISRPLAVLLFIIGGPAVWAVPQTDLSGAMEGLQHQEEAKQLWAIPDVQKEMKPDYFARIEKDAAAGDAKAQATLGLCYQTGNGVKRDLAKAVEWYEKAAKAGHAGAQNNLGCMYQYGAGVPADQIRAHDLCLAAARQNLKDAQFNVALEYAQGMGVPQAWQEARRWFEKAAAQGHPGAMTDLGNIYLFGRGVPVNFDQARKYLQGPADADSAEAQYDLAISYMLEKKFAAAVPWLRRSAEGGHPGGQIFWASYLSDGEFAQPDLPSAVFWARRALAGLAQANPRMVPQAHAELARILLTQSTPASQTEAFQEASAAAQAGNAMGQNLVGVCYHRGAGVARDLPTAAKWYRAAAERKNPTAAGNLGTLLYYGKGIPRDFTEAAKWDRLAAEAGIATAQFRLGSSYRDGTGVDINLPEALKWLRLAATGLPKDREVTSALAQLEGQMNHTDGNAAYQRGIALAQAAEPKGAPMDEAVKSLTDAAKLGQPFAITTLARMYRLGENVPQDDERADALIARVQNSSDPVVLFQIGLSYLPKSNQQPLEKNVDRALGFLQRSAQQGYGPAVGPLGFCFMTASAEHQDFVAAYEWLSLAASQGDESSRMYLERLRPRLTPAQTAEALQRLNAIRARMKPQPPGISTFAPPSSAALSGQAPPPQAAR